MNKNNYSHDISERRRLLVASAAWPALAWIGALRAQPKPPKIARIGILLPLSARSGRQLIEALREGLLDAGYVEGRNLVTEFRSADEKYERLNELAAELVQLKVDVIVTAGTPGTRAAKQATATIPIVMAVIGDPVAAGVVASLARPGGNVTGSSIFTADIQAKRVEFLKEAMPRIRRVAVLMNPDNPALVNDIKTLELTARTLKLELQQFGVRGSDGFEGAFAEMNRQRIDAVVMVDDAMLNANVQGVADIAARRRIPSAGNAAFAEVGGLIGYGTNVDKLWRRAATFIDKILKGAHPGDLPVERAITFDMVINRNTAKALGITIPQSILVRATKVIE